MEAVILPLFLLPLPSSRLQSIVVACKAAQLLVAAFYFSALGANVGSPDLAVLGRLAAVILGGRLDLDMSPLVFYLAWMTSVFVALAMLGALAAVWCWWRWAGAAATASSAAVGAAQLAGKGAEKPCQYDMKHAPWAQRVKLYVPSPCLRVRQRPNLAPATHPAGSPPRQNPPRSHWPLAWSFTAGFGLHPYLA